MPVARQILAEPGASARSGAEPGGQTARNADFPGQGAAAGHRPDRAPAGPAKWWRFYNVP